MASVRVAEVLPDATPVTLEMERSATVGLVTSAKLDADTPQAKVGPTSETVTVVPEEPKTRCADCSGTRCGRS